MTTAPAGTGPIRGWQLLTWALVAVVGVDLLFFTGASNFSASAQARILTHLILAGCAVAFGLAALKGGARVDSPMLLPIAAWVVAMAVATVASQRMATSREALAILLLALPGYLTVRAVVWTPWLRRRVQGLLVVATVLFLIAYLVQSALQWISFWSVAGLRIPPLRPGDVGLTVGTVNAVGLYIELLVPLAAWLAWRRLGRPRLAVAVAVLGLVALVVTGSRGAWLGAAAGVGVVAVLAWLRHGRPVPGLRSVPAPLVVLAGVVGTLGVVLVGPVLAQRLFAGDAGRIELWTAAWQLFTSSPLTGTGPGTFPILRPFAPISEANLAVLTSSHNSLLQVLTDGGVIALAAALLVVLAVVRLVRRALRRHPGPADASPVLVIVASLLAAVVHSLVDSQFHIIAVVLMLYLLVAHLDPPPAGPAGTVASIRRPALATGAVAVGLGALLLVPIDAAMVRAQLGNQALDRGDPGAASGEFAAALALHDLAPYRLGLGLAAARLGDPDAAAEHVGAAAAITPLTFLVAGSATVDDEDPASRLAALDAAGPYDATATLGAAAIRFDQSPASAIPDLATTMAAVPTLIASERPPTAFDEPTWDAARREAFGRIAASDPVTAAMVATLAGWDEELAAARARITDARILEALDLLDGAVQGARTPGDLDRARILVGDDPTSGALLTVIWQLGFATRSQPLLDTVAAVSVPVYFNVPIGPMEVVVDGRVDADWSLRVPRWPMASDGRNGPDRPYPAGMLTIEPVFRPGGAPSAP